MRNRNRVRFVLLYEGENCIAGAWGEWSDCTPSTHCSTSKNVPVSFAKVASTFDTGRLAMSYIMQHKTELRQQKIDCRLSGTCPELYSPPTQGPALCTGGKSTAVANSLRFARSPERSPASEVTVKRFEEKTLCMVDVREAETYSRYVDIVRSVLVLDDYISHVITFLFFALHSYLLEFAHFSGQQYTVDVLNTASVVDSLSVGLSPVERLLFLQEAPAPFRASTSTRCRS